MRRRPLAAALGLLADLALGEPPLDPHPVAAFGSFMRRVERRAYRDRRVAGVAHAAVGTAAGAMSGVVLRSTTAATYLSVSQRALAGAAMAVHQALDEGDVERARQLLPSLVGRDPHRLDHGAMVRATVESVAENSVDAVVAPALWAAVAGAPGALCYRAINTLDATVGHRNTRYGRYGWASARLDDLANLVPARVTAALVATVRPRAAVAVWQAVRRDAPAHPSPNAGVSEAAFAAALGVRLGGVNHYEGRAEVRPPLGCGRAPQTADIARAVRLSRDVAMALAAVLAVVGVAA